MTRGRQREARVDGWVCSECGLDYHTIAPGDTVVALRSYPRRYRVLLTTLADDRERADALVRRRPAPETWSALEYAAHVADMLAAIDEGVRRTLVEDEPSLELFDPDERAAAERYDRQDPDEVTERLGRAATHLADVLERVVPDEWRRRGRFPWGERDVLTMARNAVHEGAHHLRDVERVLRRVRGQPAGA